MNTIKTLWDIAKAYLWVVGIQFVILLPIYLWLIRHGKSEAESKFFIKKMLNRLGWCLSIILFVAVLIALIET